MAATEAWVLDGVALTGGNFDILELNADPPKARLDWLTAADSESAALMRQPFYENRTITMKLRVAAQASMNAALDQVGVIRDKCRLAAATSDGIALTWTPANSTRTVTFDVLAGEIPEMPIGLDGQAWSWFKQRPIFTLVLTCEPYWRGTETLSSTASSSTPFVTIDAAGTTGDAPAQGRLIVTDTATQNRRHVEWGLENQFYVSGVSPSLLIDSDSLVTSGFAGVGDTATGAYDPNATGNNTVRGNPSTQPVALAGTGVLAHVGTFRVKARVYTDSLTSKVRFSWQAGDSPFSANPYASINVINTFAEVDLGLIVIPPVALGTQRWSGRIEALSAPGAVLHIDYLLLIPAGEGYGKARATYAYQPGVLVARDEFTGTTAAAVLNARVAPAGGTWATSGATTDFLFSDSPALGDESVSRGTQSDTGSGRFAILGATNYTNVEVSAKVQWDELDVNQASGVIARYVDSSNYLIARMYRLTDGTPYHELVQIVAGVATTLGQTRANLIADRWFLIRLVAYSSGRAIATFLDADGQTVLAVHDKASSALATGGTLATGKIGINDFKGSTGTFPRYYDDFYGATPAAEPVALYSGRSMQIRHDTVKRQDSTGTYYGDPPSYRGSRFLLPPGTSRVFVKAKRNDIEVADDPNVTDALQVQVGVTPRGLVVPR